MLVFKKFMSLFLAIAMLGSICISSKADEVGYDLEGDFSTYLKYCLTFISRGSNLEYRGEERGYCDADLIIGDTCFKVPMIYISDRDNQGFAVVGFASPFGIGSYDEPSSEYLGSLIGNFVKEGYNYKLALAELSYYFNNKIKKYGDESTRLVLPQAIGDKPITTLCDWCFYGMDFVDTIDLPLTITAYDSKIFGGLPKDTIDIAVVEGSVISRLGKEDTRVSTGDIAMGDADLDGRVSSRDAMIVLRDSIGVDSNTYTDGWGNPGNSIKNYYICDLDYSKDVSAADALLILRRSVGYAY